MNLNHLKYFLAVADTLHFRLAAKNLHISQPPLSRQIKQLEKELGVELFNRNNKRVKLTKQGEYLVTETQNLFSRINSIKKSLHRIADGIVGTLKIGYIGITMDSILPNILKNLKNQFNDINTTLVNMNSNEQVLALRSADIDVGFVRMPIDTTDLIVKKIYSENFMLVTPINYNLKGSEKQILKNLSLKPFVSFSEHCGPALINSIQNICNQCGFFPNKIHETSQISTIIKLVENGLGYSIVPSSTKNSFNLKVKYTDLKSFDETSDISIAYKEGSQNPLVGNLLRIINNLHY